MSLATVLTTRVPMDFPAVTRRVCRTGVLLLEPPFTSFTWSFSVHVGTPNGCDADWWDGLLSLQLRGAWSASVTCSEVLLSGEPAKSLCKAVGMGLTLATGVACCEGVPLWEESAASCTFVGRIEFVTDDCCNGVLLLEGSGLQTLFS